MTAANGDGGEEKLIGGYTAEELVAALQASVGPENPRSDLDRRRDACEALDAYAENDADTAQYFAPILPSILMEEVERLVETGSAGELILVRGLSVDVQRTVLSVLETVVDPSIFEKLDAFDHPAVELAHPAVWILGLGLTRETTRSSAAVLANLTKWRPTAVADHIASRFDLDLVSRVLADHIQDARPGPMATGTTPASVRHATRLLAVLVVTHADELTEPEPVAEALDAAVTSDLNRAQAHIAVTTDVLVTAQPTIEEDLTSIRSFEAFVDETRAAEGDHRMDPERAVGEGVGIERLRMDDDSSADTVLEAMRDRDGYVRDAMAVAVGMHRVLDPDSLVDVRPQLRARAANADAYSQAERSAHTALGVLAFTAPESVSHGVQRFIDRFDGSHSQLDLAVLRELGSVIQRGRVDDDGVLSTLETAVRSTDGEAKERAAHGFAELLLEVPERIPEPARPLADAVNARDGVFRTLHLQALAITTIAVPDTATEPRQPLVDFWRHPDTSATERAWAKQALGELAIVDRSLANDVTEPFVERVFYGSLLRIDERAFNTRILGEIVGSNPQSPAGAIDVYVDAVRSTDDESLQWYALGALWNSIKDLASVNAKAPSGLVELVQSLERPVRIRGAAALGETVTKAPGILAEPYEPLRAACAEAERSVRIRIAQTLGEAAVRDAPTPTALCETYREIIPTLDGASRWTATQELGELLVAVPEIAPASCESLLEHARTVHRQHRLSVTATIGEVAALASADDENPLPVLEAYVAGTQGLTRRYRTRLLGEAVLAEAPDVPARANDIIESVAREGLVPEAPTFESRGSVPRAMDENWLESRRVLQEFTQTPGEWRRITVLRMLGATVSRSFDTHIARQLRAHIYEESPATPVEFHSELVEAGVLDAESFLETVLKVGSGQPVGDLDIVRERAADGLRRYLDSNEPGRREILEAVARALEQRPDTAYATRIRRQIRAFLADATAVPSSTRLQAMEILTTTRTAAEHT